MDRQAWIAVTLCVLGLIGWQFYMASHRPVPVVAPAASSPAEIAAASPTPATAAVTAPSAGENPAATAATPSPTAAGEPIAPFEEKSEILRNDDLELRLTNRGGGIAEAHLLRHVGENGDGAVVLNAGREVPIGAVLDDPASPALPEFAIARQPDGSVQFERATPEGVTLRKRFALRPDTQKKDNFVSEVQIEFRNDGTATYRNRGSFIALGSAMPIHPLDLPSYTRLVWCVDGKTKSTDVSWFAAQHYPLVGVEKRAAQAFFGAAVNPPAEWGAMSNQFFTTLLTPLNGKVSQVWARRFEEKRDDGSVLPGLEGAMAIPPFELQPGQTSSLNLQVYTGPKIYARLAELQHHEAEIMDFGYLKIVCQVLLNFMNLLHRLVGNYGLAIVLMTVCVKALLWPLQSKANKSMRRMSALAPKIQAIKDKYGKDDPTRMNTEVMKLYKEHGINPVGGCLPMFIQFPIFIGLFTMLRQAAELRGASFLWVRDLSQPDTLFTIPGLGWIPFLGHPATGLPVNVFPILMGATQFWLMRMTPKTGDSTQQRVMMFMPLIFLAFCYNFAAALAIYYTVQNLLSVLQFWHNQRQPAPVLAVTPTTPGKRTRKGRS